MSRNEPHPRDPQDRKLTAAGLTPAELTPELAAIEQQLAALPPRAARVDRDRLMFLAGAASEQGPVTRAGEVGPVRQRGKMLHHLVRQHIDSEERQAEDDARASPRLLMLWLHT